MEHLPSTTQRVMSNSLSLPTARRCAEAVKSLGALPTIGKTDSQRTSAVDLTCGVSQSEGSVDWSSDLVEIAAAAEDKGWRMLSALDVRSYPTSPEGGSAPFVVVSTVKRLDAALLLLRRSRGESAAPGVIVIIGSESDNEDSLVRAFRKCCSTENVDVILKEGPASQLRKSILLSIERVKWTRNVTAPLKDRLQQLRDEKEEALQDLNNAVSRAGNFKAMFWTIVPHLYRIIPKLQRTLPTLVETGAMLNDTQLGESLGKGSCGRVYVGTTQDDVCAVKVIDKERLDSMHKVKDLLREVTMMRRLNHANIAVLRDLWHGPEHVFLTMDLCGSRNLFSVLREFQRLDDDSSRHCTLQLMSALSHCHQQNVAHRDIKPENISVTDDSTLKLLDFGLSVYADSTCEDHCGTLPFCAPEVMVASEQHPYMPAPTDVWSAGVVLLEMLCGIGFLSKAALGTSKRVDHDTESAALMNLFFSRFETIPSAIRKDRPKAPPSLLELVSGVLDTDWERRFTAEAAANSPWLLGSDTMESS